MDETFYLLIQFQPQGEIQYTCCTRNVNTRKFCVFQRLASFWAKKMDTKLFLFNLILSMKSKFIAGGNFYRWKFDEVYLGQSNTKQQKLPAQIVWRRISVSISSILNNQI